MNSNIFDVISLNVNLRLLTGLLVVLRDCIWPYPYLARRGAEEFAKHASRVLVDLP